MKLVLKFGLEERINWDRRGYVHILSEQMGKSFDLKVADNSHSNAHIRIHKLPSSVK